jgi:glycerophosphoryl diester phosphodiesterase
MVFCVAPKKGVAAVSGDTLLYRLPRKGIFSFARCADTMHDGGMRDDLMILGHRGNAAHYVENTMAGAMQALRAGADGLEFDVQRCGNEFFVFHDPDLRRMAGDARTLDEIVPDDLRRIRLASNERIPELGEFLGAVATAGVINVELKRETIRREDFAALDAIFRASGVKDALLISSFNHALLIDYARAGYRTGMLLGAAQLSILLPVTFLCALRVRPHAVNLPWQVFATPLRRLYMRIVLFFPAFIRARRILWTVNRVKDLDLLSRVAHAIITDDPALMIAERNKFNNNGDGA